MPTIITRGAASARAFGFGRKAAPLVRGEQAYITAGTYTWVAPAGVTSVSVVAIGSGGSCGGSGAGLGYKNNYTVTPANSYTVVVGSAGAYIGANSYFVSTAVVKGGGGASNAVGGTYTGDGGGCGGSGFGAYGGSGAGGYSGNGGAGSLTMNGSGSAGAGGGGGGGATINFAGAGGGGVGIYGQGSSGAGGTGINGGGGGSGGAAGDALGGPFYCPCCATCYYTASNGGAYGSGSGYGYGSTGGKAGAVRIIWPGSTRSFPSTDVGTP